MAEPCYANGGARDADGPAVRAAAPWRGALWYPPAARKPVCNHSEGLVHPTRGFVPHVQVGNGSLFPMFNDPRSKSSSHLWLSKDGRFEQYVPFDRKAWTQVAGNPFWITCECEGYDTEDYTPVQVERLGEFFAWGVREFGWKAQATDSVNGFGIGTHRMGGRAWGGHSCPGAIRADRRPDILTAAVEVPAVDPRLRYAGMPTLREGARGVEVVTLQNAVNICLRREGDGRLTPDGVFGQRTGAQVGALQHYAAEWFGRLPVDRVCGPTTWKKIGYILTGMGRTVGSPRAADEPGEPNGGET